MREQEDALRELDDSGVIRALRWAWGSARRSTLRSFDPDTGHDQGWLGYTAYKVFTNRLDRVFRCEKFETRPDQSHSERCLVLARGMPRRDYQEIPVLPADLVERDDLNGSPGWRRGSWQILLQSFGGQHVDNIVWSQKSRTKSKVASQADPHQPPLPWDVVDLRMAADVLGELPDAPAAELSVIQLVCAYAIDFPSGDATLHLGRPRHARRGEITWHWRKSLDSRGNSDGEDGRVLQPSGAPSPEAAGNSRSDCADTTPGHVNAIT